MEVFRAAFPGCTKSHGSLCSGLAVRVFCVSSHLLGPYCSMCLALFVSKDANDLGAHRRVLSSLAHAHHGPLSTGVLLFSKQPH